MHPQENTEKLLVREWGKRIVSIGCVLFAVVILYMMEQFSTPADAKLKEGKYLTRGETDEQVELQVQGVKKDKLQKIKKNIVIDLNEREFNKNEKAELEKKVKKYLEKTLPGKNKNLEQVTEKLNFVTSVPETDVRIEWSYEEDYFYETGALKSFANTEKSDTGEKGENGETTEVQAKASWKNWEKKYYFSIHLMPVVSKAEAPDKAIKKAIKEVVKNQADQKVVELPANVDGYELYYKEEKSSEIPIHYFALAGIFFLPVYWYNRQKKDLEKRENQLFLDYPVFMNRVMLLLSAGLTVRQAMERISQEYKETIERGGEVRYVYEEVSVLAAQMRDGMSETRAIESFGKRCRQLPYLRFSSVLTQNLKKGAAGILDILERESLEAMEKRKERVLQMGEVAGTKLLFPMMLMLGIVMAIIMVPAFMTM